MQSKSIFLINIFTVSGKKLDNRNDKHCDIETITKYGIYIYTRSLWYLKHQVPNNFSTASQFLYITWNFDNFFANADKSCIN